MRIVPVTSRTSYKSRLNSGYNNDMALKRQSRAQQYKNSDAYTRLADASTKDIRIYNELKSMGLI